MFGRRSARRKQYRARRGYTVFEFSICVILLMAASTITVKIIGWLGTERRTADRKLWVNETLSNAMERISSEPFDKLDAARADVLFKSFQDGRLLPSAEWKAEVKDLGDLKPPSKKVSLSVRWKGRSGEWVAPARLTSWVYPRRNPS